MKLGGCGIILENGHDCGTRDSQEDYFAFSIPRTTGENPTESLGMILADGMGGLTDGETTSVLAVDTFSHGLTRGESLSRCAIKAHESICAMGGDTASMGSTVVALQLDPHGSGSWISIGDSTIYLFRNGELHQLNHHHVLGNLLDEAVAGFILTPDEARDRESERDHLISYLGMPGIPLMEECQSLFWQPGDTFLLASDGLTDTLTMAEIREILRHSKAGKFTHDLLTAVKTSGNLQIDNTTILAVTIETPKTEPPQEDHPFPRRMILALVLFVLACALLFLIGLSLGLKVGQQRGRKLCPDAPPIMKRQGP
ncbi:SpoIIE family protein phosphatase [Myxococcota bacterium]|nr:SpoIIE family protein phosphatase [Myxococcota bacterium]MBU1533854.1 SpoIIE family protein phosphatase [Myxococcota bacterium]